MNTWKGVGGGCGSGRRAKAPHNKATTTKTTKKHTNPTPRKLTNENAQTSEPGSGSYSAALQGLKRSTVVRVPEIVSETAA